MLRGMLEAEGFQVTHPPVREERSGGTAVEVITLTLAVTGHPLVWNSLTSVVNRFREKAPGTGVELPDRDPEEDK